jgi:hypothetical protein
MQTKKMADENYTLLDDYAACSDNCLQTLRDNLSAPSSRVNNPRQEMGENLNFFAFRFPWRKKIVKH